MKRRIAYIISFGSLVLSVLPAVAVHASVQDFVINNFTSDITLDTSDPQGRMVIKEHLDVTFSDNNHGIERAIQTYYKNQSLELSGIQASSSSGAPARYTTYKQSDFTIVRIGDPNVTVTGKQSYDISYTVKNVITFYDDHDELYWNINGTQWQQPFMNISATLHLPSGVQLSDSQPICLSGTYGATDKDCTITVSEDKKTISIASTKPQQLGGNISFVTGFRKGAFVPPTFWELYGRLVMQVAASVLILLLALGFGLTAWLRHGRDPRGKGVIVPEYAPPSGITPIEAGTLLDFRTDNRDLTAMIIDLAIRKYIRIIESTSKGVFGIGKNTDYELELLNANNSNLKSYEWFLLTNLFGNNSVGSRVKLKDLKNTFYTTASSIRKMAGKSIKEKNFMARFFIPKEFYTLAVLLASMALLLSLAGLFGPLIVVSLGLAIGIVLAFMIIMGKRTTEGVAVKEQLLGLKMYMETAEADRIKMMQSPNAPYAQNAAEPVRNVELYEKLLPYAVVMGVENEWSKQFEGLYRQPPDWYSGNYSTFSTVYLASSIGSNFSSAMNRAYAPPKSSGSSGFGGGGFSGGGGGGGGGGGW